MRASYEMKLPTGRLIEIAGHHGHGSSARLEYGNEAKTCTLIKVHT